MKTEHPVTVGANYLAREAIIYVRQSTPGQVRDHGESTRIQLSLREKAIALGWRNPEVITDDLGISAGGYAIRPGFQRLLTKVSMKEVGIIICIEASRLSRNSKDWAQLFELCGYFDTLIADAEQIYDLSRPNDRLIMGIKGTVSEMELSIIRQRLRSGLEAKAARGELRINLPMGYAYDVDGQIAFDPDLRVRKAIEQMFDQFDRATSIRQLAMWCRDTGTSFPSRTISPNAVPSWELPSHNSLRKLLLHPFYAGAYVYGRRQTRVDCIDGMLTKRRSEPGQFEAARVCIKDHHPAFISWERLLANRAKIQQNRPRWNMRQNQGAIREGLALLPGLLRCAVCGGMLRVSYKKDHALYYCASGQGGVTKRCLSVGSSLIDGRIAEELCRALQPHAVLASARAAETSDSQRAQEVEGARLQVEAAQYQADRALAQFDSCDPKNRHVAVTLEERLNTRLAELQAAKDRHQHILDAVPSMTDEKRARLEHLARDFTKVWEHKSADPKLKKRILRAAIREILVKPVAEPQLEVVIHWKGGAHTLCSVSRRERHSGMPPTSLMTLVSELAATMPDDGIARVLNLKRTTTPGGLPWTSDRVRDFRRQHHIRAGVTTSDPDVLTMNEACNYLGISCNGLLTLVRRGVVSKNQVTDFAPWRVAKKQLDSEPVQHLVAIMKQLGRLPKGGSPERQRGLFDANKGLTTEVEEGAL